MSGRRIAGAAALIAVLTVIARLAGFGRTMVFAWAVGDNDLGDIYFAANLIPNIIFEIVAGGALASLVVPLLAPALVAGDRAQVARTVSALLTWSLTILVPLAVVVAVGAHPIIAMLARDPSSGQVEAGARMLQIFAPQLPLYGIAVVLAGVLHAHRRFAWPVLAPLLSSVAVAAAYFAFVLVDGRGTDVAGLSTQGLLVLAVGTTLGVVVLAACMVPPVARLGLTVRPGWRFGAQAGERVRGLAMAGAVTLAAQHVALLVVLWRGLAGPEGTFVLFMLAQTIFLVPWAILAVPVATAAYPALAESAAAGEHARYRATLAATTRAVVLLSLLGAAAMAALAMPMATLLAHLMPGASGSVGRLAGAIAAFAPALLGYGLFAVLSRALYARGDTGPAAAAAALGWAAVAVAAVLGSAILPAEARVVALTAANSVGMTLFGAALVWAVVARAGPAAVAGLPRAVGAGLAAAGAAAVAGLAVAATAAVGDPPSAPAALMSGMLAGVVVAGVFAVMAWLLDRPDVGPMITAASRRVRSLRSRANGADGPDGDEEARA